MPKITGRLLFSVVMFSIGAFLLAYSYTTANVAAAAQFGPQFFPRILLWTWLVLALAMMAESILLKGRKYKEQNWKGLFASIGLTALACTLMPIVGFLPISLTFMLAYPWALGYRRSTVLIPLSIIFSFATWYIFNEILLIPLPEIPWLA
ncbi:tripartite tricarboxylate transporter TctB family protein [Desulfovibrio sp. OttesenSCG-928-I05]|nr:tripartite tricarboxylate transporter TctB family protein [Desulfovibrio sp. OttesenSCG-928-I05]